MPAMSQAGSGAEAATPAAVPAPASEASAPAPLEFVRASRWYSQVIALNDVSVRIPPGVTGLLGPNGAGKSTFLKLASGQLKPSQGEVRLLGRPAWGSPEVFHRVGICPEVDAFWEHLCGLDFLVHLLRLSGYDDQECRHRAENALHQVALLDAKHRKIGGYSKGMRQRVKLAQAIAHEPEVLLLDEPVSGMDPLNRRRVIELVRRLGREGRTVVVSSHILHEVEAMTRRVLLVHNGRIQAEGDVREIREMMDEHPHTVALRARDPRRLAAAIVGWPNVLSMSFGTDGEWLTVQTARPDEFYRSLHQPALDAGVVEMYSPDENLESVFRYLVAR
ncbi:MAG TPA: ABC transporter ATP-binding protein [Vicinamibacteria bacterium]|nr:ABC transporter ATP-binding protein [Vicinamibacteria bacterium]